MFWGAETDPTYTGPGQRWRLDPNLQSAAMLPVGGIGWRTAAKYCNWLHNGKDPSTQAIENGAYDTATFGSGGGITFTDQWHHHPDAKFWIPTLDEWIKAAHYDPNRFGPGQEGWWNYSYGSDQPPIPGPPGIGQTNAADIPAADLIPLGAYSEYQSPWGLWDTSGGAAEWTEEVVLPSFPFGRAVQGSFFGYEQPTLEAIWEIDEVPPWGGHSRGGFRVASTIPSPGPGLIGLAAISWLTQRRRSR